LRALALGLLLCAGALPAQEPAKVTFHLDREGLEIPRFTLSVDEQGDGSYHAEVALPKSLPATQPGEPAEPSAPPPAIDRKVTLSAATTAKIFALAREADRFSTACESKVKNVANMGTKTLTYAGPDGTGTCVYNYSDVKPVVALTDIFLAVQQTLEMGRQMDFKRRFDRLGLDAVMISLSQMLEAHQAMEVGTISQSLRTIASDTELMQRVRLRAAKMLEQVDSASR
jgi:hypothetical protein